MPTPIDPWLADLIQTHLDSLAADMIAYVRQSSPAHQRLDPAAVRAGFVAFYQALAAVVATGDPAPMRTHLRQVIPLRLQAGASGADLVRLVDTLQEQVLQLIDAAAGAPAQAQSARRHLTTVQNNVRLIVSEINLQHLGDS
ncbi:MAG TPA: RsbRD N-terminal domain-containing protein [Chloroflexia bacterium]|nr:RsbRD N-terminal domain-containing protein [Chloroflexia bacterium]